MSTDIGTRSERREEIRLMLEYLKVLFSLGVIATVIFAGLQWRVANETAAFANQIAKENTYQRIATEWRDHIRTLVDKPHLRPYFEEKKPLNADDPNRDTVLAYADVRLSVMDDLLTYAEMREKNAQIDGWKNLFAATFKTSPLMCTRLMETSSSFGLIVPIALVACAPAPMR